MADWDPTTPQPGAPAKPALHRARIDYRRLCEEPLEGIVAVPDAKDAMKFHVLVSGPAGTPYEGGSFYFLLRLPHDYPHSPPRAKILTTGGGGVRFNPNLYANGKVCLSILGTWQGPGWSPAQNLSSVLLSIQSLMSERPYTNEPGFEVRCVALRCDAHAAEQKARVNTRAAFALRRSSSRVPALTPVRVPRARRRQVARSEKDVQDLSDIIAHETLRVACLDNVKVRASAPRRAGRPRRARGRAWRERRASERTALCASARA